MPRKYRVAVTLVMVISLTFVVYRFIWLPYTQSRALVEAEPLVPDIYSVVPGTTTPAPTITPNATSPPNKVPDGRFEWYLGISDRDLVTIYRWVDGNLVIVQELEQLPTERLRAEDQEEVSAFIGANTEEEIWQKIEGLTH